MARDTVHTYTVSKPFVYSQSQYCPNNRNKTFSPNRAALVLTVQLRVLKSPQHFVHDNPVASLIKAGRILHVDLNNTSE